MTGPSTELRSDAGPMSELQLRPFDPDRDFPAIVELITAVNHHDQDFALSVSGAFVRQVG